MTQEILQLFAAHIDQQLGVPYSGRRVCLIGRDCAKVESGKSGGTGAASAVQFSSGMQTTSAFATGIMSRLTDPMKVFPGLKQFIRRIPDDTIISSYLSSSDPGVWHFPENGRDIFGRKFVTCSFASPLCC